MTEKMLEKIEFFSGQFHRVAAAQNLIAPEVDLDVAKGIAIHLLRQSLRAAQYGLDASEQFANGERFGDVIIGAELEADDLIYFLTARGEHDDGNGRPFGLELLAHIESAHAGHHDVENHQVRRILESVLQPFHAIERRIDVKTFVLEIIAETGD